MNSLEQLLISRIELIVTIVAAIGAIAAHWRRTGRFPRGKLPLRAMQTLWKDLKTQYFTAEQPDAPGLLVKCTHDELEEVLRERQFESVDLYSYEYEGEVLNMRTPSGLVEGVPQELHVRTFDTERDGWIRLLVHDEGSRFEAWENHYFAKMMSWERGREKMVDYIDFEWEKDG